MLPEVEPKNPEAPVATNELDGIGIAALFQTFEEGGAEVVVHEGGLLYVTNGAFGGIDVWDIATESLVDFYDLTVLPGFDGVQSVAVKNGLVAVAVSTPDATEEVFGETVNVGQDGYVALIDSASGSIIDRVTVGNVPDMVTFNEDGTKILVANEGEFSGESDLDKDPIGSVSIIDVSNGANRSARNRSDLRQLRRPRSAGQGEWHPSEHGRLAAAGPRARVHRGGG